uniref:Uncharacterized protein n=1 Tax=Anguilla anguilla TaxID=7936 RepID=A0A0E9QY71_ANGAN
MYSVELKQHCTFYCVLSP